MVRISVNLIVNRGMISSKINFDVRNAAKTTSFKMWMSISEHPKIPNKPTLLSVGKTQEFFDFHIFKYFRSGLSLYTLRNSTHFLIKGSLAPYFLDAE